MWIVRCVFFVVVLFVGEAEDKFPQSWTIKLTIQQQPVLSVNTTSSNNVYANLNTNRGPKKSSLILGVTTLKKKKKCYIVEV